VRSREPIVELLRRECSSTGSDAVGVDDIPAVFAQRDCGTVREGPPRSAPGVVVPQSRRLTSNLAAPEIRAPYRESRPRGIRETRLFQAFRRRHEVEEQAREPTTRTRRRWIEHPDNRRPVDRTSRRRRIRDRVFVGKLFDYDADRRVAGRPVFVCCVTGLQAGWGDAIRRGAFDDQSDRGGCGAGEECGRCRRTLRKIARPTNGGPQRRAHMRIPDAGAAIPREVGSDEFGSTGRECPGAHDPAAIKHHPDHGDRPPRERVGEFSRSFRPKYQVVGHHRTRCGNVARASDKCNCSDAVLVNRPLDWCSRRLLLRDDRRQSLARKERGPQLLQRSDARRRRRAAAPRLRCRSARPRRAWPAACIR